MRIGGVVLAGGQSHRFGSDKAAALFRGRTLLDFSIMGLRPHCDLVLVSGRFHPAHPLSADRPGRGFGPLGGLAGAMQRANALGFSHLLSLPCDTPHLPDGLLAALLLRAEGAYAAACPVIGFWPTRLGGGLERYLARGGSKAVRSWAESENIAPLTGFGDIPNINSVSDFARIVRRHG
ncbi:molybdenum cofactor guanylyltransferase [Sphingopyxis sp. GC21]|uniref:molybdenum cofactor guanylyltransferase n=1 Tax=Sphingopyxis sp. GC21 TaxID=2933562 RepID=UPI0021E4A750|nr:molybdenum cofactor guanylyltransferase [Sphingopyxis sp. GC21]